MTDADTDPVGVPEADRVEQQTPAAALDPDEAPGAVTAPSVNGADEADVLEQASPVPADEDDYPHADPEDRGI